MGGGKRGKNTPKVEKILWDPAKKEEFQVNVCTDNSMERINNLITDLENAEGTDIENNLSNFTDILKEAGKCMTRTVGGGGGKWTKNIWYDQDCRDKKKEAKKAFDKLRKSEDNTNQSSRDEALNDYKHKKRQYTDTVKAKKKDFRQKTYKEIMDNRNDSSKFWKLIKKVRRSRPSTVDIALNKWEQHFRKVYRSSEGEGEVEQENTAKAPVEQSREREENVNIVEELDREITEDEVINAVKKLKSGKASGVDEIPPEFLKAGSEKLIKYLTKLFNVMFNQGFFPRSWSQAIIVPIYKKGCHSQTSNYRGVALLSTISKLFTAIITERVSSWAFTNNKVCKEQAGFRKGYSTIDHIFSVYQIISNSLFSRKKHKLYTVYVDYKLAFDSVNRAKLWEILEGTGVSTKVINMLKGIYMNVTGRVRFNNQLTVTIACPIGLR